MWLQRWIKLSKSRTDGIEPSLYGFIVDAFGDDDTGRIEEFDLIDRQDLPQLLPSLFIGVDSYELPFASIQEA